MNEVMKYEIEVDGGEFAASLDLEKENILNKLAGGRSSALELLSYSCTDHFVTQYALNQLRADGGIRYIEDGELSSHNNVVVMYELVRGVENIAVSAHPAITSLYEALYERAYENGDINKADSVEWCLLYILEKADESVRSGRLAIDMGTIRDKMVNDLADEGEEKWELAFDNAASIAHELFKPHPDSIGM